MWCVASLRRCAEYVLTSLLFLNIWAAVRALATLSSNLNHLDCRSMVPSKHSHLLSAPCTCSTVASLRTSVSSSLTGGRPGHTGHSSLGCIKKSGPCSHLRSPSLEAFVGRDASSAGLRPVGTYRQSSGDVNSLISPTRLATKVLKRRSSLLMYLRTVVLSTQKTERPSGTSCSLADLEALSHPSEASSCRHLGRFSWHSPGMG